jgi:hypothetical protein
MRGVDPVVGKPRMLYSRNDEIPETSGLQADGAREHAG